MVNLKQVVVYWTKILIDACGNLAKMKAEYKMGGKKHIREMINNFLEYIATGYRDSLELCTDITIDDLLDSPKLMPCIEAVAEALQKMNKRIATDPKLINISIEVRKLLHAYTDVGNMIIDPLDSQGRIKPNEEIRREYEELLRYSRGRQEAFYRQRFFSDLLVKNHGDVEKAKKEFESSSEFNNILKNGYELRSKDGHPNIDPIDNDGKLRDLEEVKADYEKYLNREQRYRTTHERQDNFNLLVEKYNGNVEKAYAEFKALYIKV